MFWLEIMMESWRKANKSRKRKMEAEGEIENISM